jgi:hypothetical protein
VRAKKCVVVIQHVIQQTTKFFPPIVGIQCIMNASQFTITVQEPFDLVGCAHCYVEERLIYENSRRG